MNATCPYLRDAESPKTIVSMKIVAGSLREPPAYATEFRAFLLFRLRHTECAYYFAVPPEIRENTTHMRKTVGNIASLTAKKKSVT
jgi:hypothetical protein